MKRTVNFAWILIYGAFVGAAYALRVWMVRQGATEIWGWDYQTFVEQIQDWNWIGYFGFRHPGLGLVCSPLVALEHVWSGAYLFVMPAVATATARIIWKMAGWVGLGVWLSFPTTWVLAGTPESFPVAQLALVGSFYWLINEKDVAARRGRRALPLASGRWRSGLICGMFMILNAAITLTNGLKPLLGWLVMHWRELDRKVLVRGGLAVMGVMLLGVALFYVRTLLTGRGMGAGIAATLSWIPPERNLPRELYGFFIRPVGFCQAFVVYPLALYGIFKSIRTHHTSYLLLLTSYFAVDVFIHCIVGWGMAEPWVFAPHWIWTLPILIGREFWYSSGEGAVRNSKAND